MQALTLHQPMAWHLARGNKPIENRPRPLPPHLLGRPVAVHAGLTYNHAHLRWLREHYEVVGPTPDRDQLVFGALLGVVTPVRVVTSYAEAVEAVGARFAAWFTGPFGIVVTNVWRLGEPIPCRGRQGWWTLTPELESALRAQGWRE